ncbi:MAG: c-type cytochrome [Trueperaceae bacterium]
MTRVLFFIFLSLVLSVLDIAITQKSVTQEFVTQEQSQMRRAAELAPEISEVIAGYGEQVRRGAEAYDLVCSNCHGNTGLGISEGRAEFLPEHQRCEKCHRPHNAPTMANVKISEKNSFNIGEPPALNDLSKFGSAAGLNVYIQAAMPRHNPGQLSEQEYLDITAFLLVLNKALPKGSLITLENSPTISF